MVPATDLFTLEYLERRIAARRAKRRAEMAAKPSLILWHKSGYGVDVNRGGLYRIEKGNPVRISPEGTEAGEECQDNAALAKLLKPSTPDDGS